MKFTAFLAILVIFVDLSEQIPKLKNCPSDFTPTSAMQNSCGILTCIKSASISIVGCPVYQCTEGKEIGYKQEDDSKVYPECCGGPICAD